MIDVKLKIESYPITARTYAKRMRILLYETAAQ